ncbi:MAG: TonB-dependent receptor [Acidobacteria bacterium]|nr:TonB-dependent receptor [Acidobacteriota bacterium]
MGTLIVTLLMLTVGILAPVAAYAQASITGVVKDTSGAVLPGVTVEASSPALIEKVRVVVSDGTGQYRIVDLRPGTYTVTFTLPGFASVVRPGIQLEGIFTATVNVEMRVGELAETITVRGEAPIVDVQNATRQQVMDREVIDEIPTGRLSSNLATLIPGVSGTATSGGINQDVGGSLGENITELVIHGSRGSDMRQTLNGVTIGTMTRDGGQANITPSFGSVQEITIDTSGVDATLGQGGVRVNFIPRDGGNDFKGSVFFTATTDDFQSDNLGQRLIERGFLANNSVDRIVDFNPAGGGPIKKDKLWFWFAWRHNEVDNFVGGNAVNRNAGDPAAFTRAPDADEPAVSKLDSKNRSLRLTWQATQRHKLALYVDDQTRCVCPTINATTSPESAALFWSRTMRHYQADWTFPMTNRLMFDATVFQRGFPWATQGRPENASTLTAVTEQSDGFLFRGRPAWNRGRTENTVYRAALSYVTGAHSAKVGFSHGFGLNRLTTFSSNPLSMRLNNGVPNLISLNANPIDSNMRLDADVGVYAQDKWTIRRLTLSGGLRFDYFKDGAKATFVGPSPLTPDRNFLFPETDGVEWKDITPKLAASYDVFGNGKTAVRGTLNKYVRGQGLTGLFGADLAPVARLVNATTRSWNDANRNFIPDCDVINPQANGECGRMANVNFGRELGTTFDPDVLSGWGTREYNWEFSAGVQHEILPRVSVDVAYFRRWFGNFITTDNLAFSPADFDRFGIVAPTDPRLEDASGRTIPDLFELTPASFGRPANNLVTFADNFGDQYENWNGMDVTARARLRNGLLAQGGISTGKTTTDNCDVREALPESAQFNPYCHVETGFQTQVKGFGSYTLPRVDVQVALTYQSLPGPQIVGNFVAGNAVVAPGLGRNLSGGRQNITVNVVEPGTAYGERLHQFDFRVGKGFRLRRTRTVVNLDVFNLFNEDTVIGENPNFGVFRRPTVVLQPRLFKISAQLDF